MVATRLQISNVISPKQEEVIDDDRNPGVVYISHAPHGFYEKQLLQYFSQYGRVLSVKLSRSKKNDKSKGYSFIKFKYAAVAETCHNYLFFNKFVSGRDRYCLDMSGVRDKLEQKARELSVERTLKKCGRKLYGLVYVYTDKMDPKIAKKTQDTLGKVIKKPPLTDKLLGKPPFRFLHDIITSVIKTTGFMQGLFTETEMNSENVKDKDSKIAFLQKAIDLVCAVTGKELSVKPVKIVAGHEPERTNEFLQVLADAINKNVDNDEFVKRVLKGGQGGGLVKEGKKEERKDKSRSGADRKKERDSEGKDRPEKEERKREKSRDKGDREGERRPDRDRERDKELDRGKVERERDKERERHKDRERGEPPKTRDKSREGRDEHHRDRERSKKAMCSGSQYAIIEEEEPKFTAVVASHVQRSPGGDSVSPKRHCHNSSAAGGQGPKLPVDQKPEEMARGDHGNLLLDREHGQEKENESPDREKMKEETGEKPITQARMQRPSSAKGSRRRREGEENGEDDGAEEEDEEFQKPTAREPTMGEDDLPPQVAAARQLARPPSARPAPPRPKQEVLESEPAMRLGTGAPTNLIVDNDNDDEDENFLVEESAPPPPELDPVPLKPTEEDGAEHGALVKKMLESKKELEGGSQAGPVKKTEIERPIMSDAQRRKQRELVQKEIEKLRASIQSLTRSANPLGKVMDYVQEDMDSMQQELDKWRAENAQHALDLKREMGVTDRAVDPLRQQLAELDRGLKDQLDRIAATKCSIIKNDQKIHRMLQGITSS